jgi:hypothetical protein
MGVHDYVMKNVKRVLAFCGMRKLQEVDEVFLISQYEIVV